MGKLIGLLLLAAGLGFALEMLPVGFVDRGTSLVAPTVAWLSGIRESTAASPTHPATSQIDKPALATEQRAPRVFTAGQPLVQQTAQASQGSASVLRVVAEPAANGRNDAPSTDPSGLVRLLQTELRRVGCYSGDVDGTWGVTSRRAMQAFTDRVNSTLPTDKPDLVLLSLLRGHGQQICSSECGTGQIMSSRGHCVRVTTAEAAAAAPRDGWRPVVVLQNQALPQAGRAQTAQRTTAPSDQTPTTAGTTAQTVVRRVTVTTGQPALVAEPTLARREPAQSREIDWGSRMSAGALPPSAVATPPASSSQPTLAAVTQPPATPTPATARAPRSAIIQAPSPPQRERRAERAAPRYVERPAAVDRPAPSSNWRQRAFTSGN